MRYSEETERTLTLAGEKVSEAAQALEDILPDTAAELDWIRESIREELVMSRSPAVRTEGLFGEEEEA